MKYVSYIFALVTVGFVYAFCFSHGQQALDYSLAAFFSSGFTLIFIDFML